MTGTHCFIYKDGGTLGIFSKGIVLIINSKRIQQALKCLVRPSLKKAQRAQSAQSALKAQRKKLKELKVLKVLRELKVLKVL